MDCIKPDISNGKPGSLERIEDLVKFYEQYGSQELSPFKEEPSIFNYLAKEKQKIFSLIELLRWSKRNDNEH